MKKLSVSAVLFIAACTQTIYSGPGVEQALNQCKYEVRSTATTAAASNPIFAVVMVGDLMRDCMTAKGFSPQ